ncbi:hypothetical protein J6590_052447 [Homalodisca vitripennis]|nr:hypothetical protein J6590_052447 [Homalodisca vitripennis]
MNYNKKKDRRKKNNGMVSCRAVNHASPHVSDCTTLLTTLLRNITSKVTERPRGSVMYVLTVTCELDRSLKRPEDLSTLVPRCAHRHARSPAYLPSLLFR